MAAFCHTNAKLCLSPSKPEFALIPAFPATLPVSCAQSEKLKLGTI